MWEARVRGAEKEEGRVQRAVCMSQDALHAHLCVHTNGGWEKAKSAVFILHLLTFLRVSVSLRVSALFVSADRTLSLSFHPPL